MPSNFVNASLNLKDQNDNNLAYTEVKIVNTSNNTFGIGFTDSLGYLKMRVPVNAPLQLNVIGRCKDVLLSKQIGVFSSDVILDDVTVEIPESGSVLLNGTAVNCDHQPVQNGFANVFIDGLNYRSEINEGHFSILINRCLTTTTTASVFVGDINAQKRKCSSRSCRK